MLAIKQEKHLLYFDKEKKCFSSFLLEIREREDAGERKNKQQVVNDSTQINGLLGNNSFLLSDVTRFTCTFRLENAFTHKWESQFYDLKIQQAWGQQPKMHKIPLSLQTYFALYKNPLQWKVSLVLKPKYSDTTKYQQKQVLQRIIKGQSLIGKLIITSSFMHARKNQPFRIPVWLNSQKDISQQGKKTAKIISVKDDDTIICSGLMGEQQYCQKISNFAIKQSLLQVKAATQFRICTFVINPRVNTESICVLKHSKLNLLQFQFNKILIKIYSPQQPKFIPTLAKLFQNLRTMLQIEPLTIVQNVPTTIESAHGVVFFTDLITLPQRIFRSYLYDKIEDKWLIQGMVSYSRSNKMFQDCMSELIEMMNQGEEFFPLINDTYHFDQVWKAKARFFFYVLANFKSTRDYGSSTLVGLILQYSQKKKITSTYLFRRLKKKYGLDGSFRSIYQQQFTKSTGLNRIFYQLIDIRRDNSVKFIVRQKSLLNKFFKTYNLFRIKLEQAYGEVSPMMERIVRKNKYDEMSSKRKDLPGPLAVPEFIKCLPYFRGKMTVESDACEPFELELIEQNILQKTKLSSSLRSRPAARKPGQVDKGIDGFTWMMIDTAYIFPAVYKNENVHQNVILQRIKKVYDSEQQEIKVLNCISSTNHSQNQEICKALLQKLKMQPKLNTTLSVKRKILQIIPIFINKLKDSTIWQDYYALFQLYEPPCYDYSDDGYQFLTSLIESSTTLVYKKEFSYYFNELHRILLAILLNHQIPTSQQKQLRLKNLLYKSLMKWRSKYSFEILKNVYEQLEMLAISVRNNLVMIKVVVENLIKFVDEVEPQSVAKTELITNTRLLIEKCIDEDISGQLYATRFHYQLSIKEKSLSSLDFLRYAFKQLQSLQGQSKRQHYWLSLKSFKNILQLNKMKYGLKIQLDQLNEDQSYFVAEYLWGRMCSREALINAKVRMQWMKIYRIFYFYFTPIITIHKLKKALRQSQRQSQGENNSQFSISQQQLQELLSNCAQLSFIPDIRWMSSYDSSAAKEQKAKYQQYNLQNNRRKRKFQELSFTESNIITRFIKENPGKDNWEDIAREALRIIILIEEKKEVDNPQQAERFKKIVQGLKNVQNFLKRGNMPNDYSLQKVRIQAQYVLRQYQQDTQKLQQIFQMVQSAVQSIKQQRRQKQIQKENQMKIFIPKDWMAIEDQDMNMQNMKSLHAIKEYPEEQGEEDERTIMRKIVEDDQKGDGEDIEIDGLGVQRYSSMFEE